LMGGVVELPVPVGCLPDILVPVDKNDIGPSLMIVPQDFGIHRP
jgi:hypothetical protein